MSEYLVRKGKLFYEIAKFEDSDSPTDVYTFYARGCSCPARGASCKHSRILNTWKKMKEPVGTVFNDNAEVINTLYVN